MKTYIKNHSYKKKKAGQSHFSESPKSKQIQTPDLEIEFLIDSGAESNIINIPIWNETKILQPKLIPFKTTSRLATAKGSTSTNYGKIQFFLVRTQTMEQNKLMSKPSTSLISNIISLQYHFLLNIYQR